MKLISFFNLFFGTFFGLCILRNIIPLLFIRTIWRNAVVHVILVSRLFKKIIWIRNTFLQVFGLHHRWRVVYYFGNYFGRNFFFILFFFRKFISFLRVSVRNNRVSYGDFFLKSGIIHDLVDWLMRIFNICKNLV